MLRTLARRGGRYALGLLLASTLACGEGAVTCPPLVVSSDNECKTTEDCVDAGFSTLRCVNQVCALPCDSDVQCRLAPRDECPNDGAPPKAVCQDRVCQLACTEDSCGGGEQCHQGRCVVAFEDFEKRPDETVSSFERFGWNALPTELRNRRNRVVFTSTRAINCSLGDDDCPGVAASGTQFAVLGTEPTSEKGRPTTGPTCRPCACCLECTVNPYPSDPTIADRCPVGDLPAPLMCMAPAATCATVCDACAQCPDATDRSPAGLASCEAVAAAKTCPACPACDALSCRDCRNTTCGSACADLDSEACRMCEAASCPACSDCRACDVCGEATNCERVDPSAARCRAKRLECDALGNDGCYTTATRYDRSELTPGEQALVSPEVDLSGRAGEVVISFAYVPFGVGETYFESKQGIPAGMWQNRPQEVVVELCGERCEEASSWQAGTLRGSGEAVSIPSQGRRNNGLSLGKQSEVDWRSGRLEVLVPEALRTATFRYRFLPRLGRESAVGIDDIRLEVR